MKREMKDGGEPIDQSADGVPFGFSSGRGNVEVFSWEAIAGFVNRATATHFKVRSFDSPDGRFLFNGEQFDLFPPEDRPIQLPDKTEGLYKVELFKQVHGSGTPKLQRVPIRPYNGGQEFDILVNLTGRSLFNPATQTQLVAAASTQQPAVRRLPRDPEPQIVSTEQLTQAGLGHLLGVVLKALNDSYETQGKQAGRMNEYVDRLERRLDETEKSLKAKEKKLRKQKKKESSAVDRLAKAVENDPTVLKDTLAGIFALAAQWSPMAAEFKSRAENPDDTEPYPASRSRRKNPG